LAHRPREAAVRHVSDLNTTAARAKQRCSRYRRIRPFRAVSGGVSLCSDAENQAGVNAIALHLGLNVLF
jgi:hypothetical protein